MEENPISDAVTRKKRKCGIIYISTLPPHMNVTKIREIFSTYGDIGRVFLQPADTDKGLKLCIVSLEYIRATVSPPFYC
jgi:RNA recognition motif-containing protein